jgi:hypothetical protein
LSDVGDLLREAVFVLEGFHDRVADGGGDLDTAGLLVVGDAQLEGVKDLALQLGGASWRALVRSGMRASAASSCFES